MNSPERDSLQDLLLAYIDGALDAETMSRVGATIQTDPEIRSEFAALRSVCNGLEGLGDDRREAIAPIDLTAAVLTRVRNLPEHAAIPDDFLDRDAFAEETLAYWDGELGEAERANFERRLSESPVHRDEFDLLTELSATLDAVGRAGKGGLPAIDVSQAVLAAVSGREAAEEPANVVPLRRRSLGWLAATAAAAAIGVLLWQAFDPAMVDAPGPQLAQRPLEAPVPAPASDPATPEMAASPAPEDTRLAEAKEQFKLALGNLPVDGTERPTASAFASTAAPNLSEMTVEGVLALRRAAITAGSFEERSQRRAELAQLAKLDGETAAAIAYDPAMPAMARLGAAGMLPPGEALAAAQAVAAEMPDSLYAQLAAAEAALLQEQAEPGSVPLEAILDPLRRLQAMDPENATPYMMEAAALLQAGDIEGALAALQAADGLTTADAYSGEAALATSAALEAGGMPAEAALTTAALNAGYTEYSSLFDLGLDLLELGTSFAAGGDAETADAIFGSVSSFAGALYQAPYTFEQLAGLDLQRQTLSFVERFSSDIQQEVAAVEQLTSDALAVLNGMTNVRNVLDIVDGVLLLPLDEAQTSAIVETLIGQGDTGLANQYAP